MKNGLVEHANGCREWFLNDKLHREDGPAIEYPNLYRAWYINGERHRIDGPAIESSNGAREWYRAGCPYGISIVYDWVKIGFKVKTIAAWDEWFAGAEKFNHKRDSKEFAVLLELWAQFKEQVGEVVG